MEVKYKYLTYEKYKGLGGSIPLMSFERLEYKAEKYIDSLSNGRFKNESKFPKELEMCVYDLVEMLYKADYSSGIASESDGNYSITYKSETSKETEDNVNKTIKMWLLDTEINGVPALYCGADE